MSKKFSQTILIKDDVQQFISFGVYEVNSLDDNRVLKPILDLLKGKLSNYISLDTCQMCEKIGFIIYYCKNSWIIDFGKRYSIVITSYEQHVDDFIKYLNNDMTKKTFGKFVDLSKSGEDIVGTILHRSFLESLKIKIEKEYNN